MVQRMGTTGCGESCTISGGVEYVARGGVFFVAALRFGRWCRARERSACRCCSVTHFSQAAGGGPVGWSANRTSRRERERERANGRERKWGEKKARKTRTNERTGTACRPAVPLTRVSLTFPESGRTSIHERYTATTLARASGSSMYYGAHTRHTNPGAPSRTTPMGIFCECIAWRWRTAFSPHTRALAIAVARSSGRYVGRAPLPTTSYTERNDYFTEVKRCGEVG